MFGGDVIKINILGKESKMVEIIEKINKIKYHIKMIGDTINHSEYPIESLVIQLDWNDNDLSEANDIFEKYDKKFNSGEDINWTKFEMTLRDRFGIGYQTVKSIILAFYRNNLWRDVCRGYALKNNVSEFNEILHQN